MVNEQMVNMKKMYKEPKTVTEAIEASMNICHVSADGNVQVNNTEEVTNQKIF